MPDDFIKTPDNVNKCKINVIANTVIKVLLQVMIVNVTLYGTMGSF